MNRIRGLITRGLLKIKYLLNKYEKTAIVSQFLKTEVFV